jgi:hypothetical protein
MTAWRPDTQASKNPMSPQREPHNLSIRSGQHLQHAREERREGGGGEKVWGWVLAYRTPSHPPT